MRTNIEDFKTALREHLTAETTFEDLLKLLADGTVSRAGLHPTQVRLAIQYVLTLKPKASEKPKVAETKAKSTKTRKASAKEKVDEDKGAETQEATDESTSTDESPEVTE